MKYLPLILLLASCTTGQKTSIVQEKSGAYVAAYGVASTAQDADDLTLSASDGSVIAKIPVSSIQNQITSLKK